MGDEITALVSRLWTRHKRAKNNIELLKIRPETRHKWITLRKTHESNCYKSLVSCDSQTRASIREK